LNQSIIQKQILALIIGLIFSIIFLNIYFGIRKTNFEDAQAMGANTTSLMSSVDGHRIHCGDSRDVANCIRGIEIKKPKNVALWLGNSQLHAVNQLKENQLNAPPIAFYDLKKHSIYLIALSQPNANLQEHYLIYFHLSQQISIKYLILPVVFDDLREDGIRPEILAFAENSNKKNKLSLSETGRKSLEMLHKVPTTKDDINRLALHGKLQDKSEKLLDDMFKENFLFWRSREEARGVIFQNMYLARNTLFGINPSTKRKTIKGYYQANMIALKNILELSNAQSTKVIVYVAPIRNDIDTPYPLDEYEKFQKETEELSIRHNAIFLNLENLVPGKLWGQKNSTNLNGKTEIDFMHFQSEGHSLLAKEIVTNLKKID
jgi:hypothetical protein